MLASAIVRLPGTIISQTGSLVSKGQPKSNSKTRAVSEEINTPTVRVAYDSKTPIKDKINKAYDDLNNSSSWGNGEVKPWHERYQDKESDYPYQGSY